MAVSIALICVLGYLLGGINGAILLSKLVEKDDVRRHGSGNAGFTNFFRNYGKRTSLLVILIDAAKAAVSCLLGGWLLGKCGLRTEGMLLGGLAATLGHDFPAFLGFRGGKGIVCGFATALVTDWRVGLILLAVFALVYFLTHYVSLASVLCALGLFVSFWLFYPGRPFVLILSGCLSALAIFLHRENIGRLVRGQERKTYFFKRGETK
ncbi:MAG: glycerol-3-phosphate 1-O-acyltransferase PlsY [Eubacteriales bacterium]|nr:glycerol-3-phosphate 1-O-acyltransferase PlsY [Clostridiales bacterium]MDD6370920.1 glycerol-3-phosphate 1-O-acyltransferase PlsY [Eubacteriales bacterium]MDD7258949.1 glycerol-3-phosphate 1-O-acyltransferase PlsY [Eubacteriales bacterium]